MSTSPVAWLLLGLSSCAGFSTLKTARSIDPGEAEVTVAIGAVEVGAAALCPPGETNTASCAAQEAVAPQAEIAVRYGLGPRVDVGGQCWWGGCEVNSTISIVRGERLEVAAAPALGATGYTFALPATTMARGEVVDAFVKVPLLLGWRFGPFGRDEVVLGPEVVEVLANQFVQSSGLQPQEMSPNAPRMQVGALLGALVGVSVRLAPWLRVMPELTVLAPVSPFPTLSSQVIQQFGESGSLLYELAVGVAWGDDGLSSVGL